MQARFREARVAQPTTRSPRVAPRAQEQACFDEQRVQHVRSIPPTCPHALRARRSPPPSFEQVEEPASAERVQLGLDRLPREQVDLFRQERDEFLRAGACRGG